MENYAFCCFLGMAMGSIASFFIDGESIDDTLKLIKTEVKPHEIAMLTDFGLANDDDAIDKGG
jgi:hypothetical protein